MQVYEKYLSASGLIAVYPDDDRHKVEADAGIHVHNKKKVKKKKLDKNNKPILDAQGQQIFEEVLVAHKIKYPIPASDFKDQTYWKSGNFYYETSVKVAIGISATITAGKSIFWKVTKTRLTESKPSLK